MEIHTCTSKHVCIYAEMALPRTLTRKIFPKTLALVILDSEGEKVGGKVSWHTWQSRRSTFFMTKEVCKGLMPPQIL